MKPINEERALACLNLGIGLVYVKFRCKRPGCNFTFDVNSQAHRPDNHFTRYVMPRSEFCCSSCFGNSVLEKKIYLEDATNEDRT